MRKYFGVPMVAFGLALAAPAAVLVASPVLAKEQKASSKPALTKAVRKALVEAQKAQDAGQFEGVLTYVRRAEEVPDLTPLDRQVINQFKLNAGLGKNDKALIEEAAVGLLESGLSTPEDEGKLRRNLINYAIERDDFAQAIVRAEAYLVKVPGDGDVAILLGKLHLNRDNPASAYATFSQLIATREAAGAAILPQEVYKLNASAALRLKDRAKVSAAMQALVARYPTLENWRDAMMLYRERSGLDDLVLLDSFRLQQRTGSLVSEVDYLEMADIALKHALPGDAKTALEEGQKKAVFAKGAAWAKQSLAQASRKVVEDRRSLGAQEKEARAAKTGDLALSVGNAYYSYGDFAKAQDLLGLALEKGVKTPDAAQLRFGMAATGAGRHLIAAAAFGKVVAPDVQELAQFWSIYAKSQQATVLAPAAVVTP